MLFRSRDRLRRAAAAAGAGQSLRRHQSLCGCGQAMQPLRGEEEALRRRSQPLCRAKALRCCQSLRCEGAMWRQETLRSQDTMRGPKQTGRATCMGKMMQEVSITVYTVLLTHKKKTNQ